MSRRLSSRLGARIMGAKLLSAGLLLATFAGCGKSDAPVPLATGPLPSQVLKQFQMQDLRNGQRSMVLDSVEGRVYDERHQADLDQPIVTFYKEGKPSSTLRAPKGQVDMITHDVTAWGGVTIVTTDSATLTTERMHYDPAKDKVLSDDPVHMEKPDSVTDGIGLDADPELTSVKIKHQHIRFKQGLEK